MQEKIIEIKSKENYMTRQSNSRVRLRKLIVRKEGDILTIVGVSQKGLSTTTPPMMLELDEEGANAFVAAIGSFHFMDNPVYKRDISSADEGEIAYNITETETVYKIHCESCLNVVVCKDAEKVGHHAEQAGYLAIQTAEDGTMNFCPNCTGMMENKAKNNQKIIAN